MIINFEKWVELGGPDFVYRRIYIFGLWTPFCRVEDRDNDNRKSWKVWRRE